MQASFSIILHNNFSMNFSICGSSAWWLRALDCPGCPGQSACDPTATFRGQHDVSENTITFLITIQSGYQVLTNMTFGKFSTPNFERLTFFPWLVNQLHVALVRGSLTPRQICISSLWNVIDRTGPSESSLLWCCVTPDSTAVLITLGFMTLRVWHEWDSGIEGGRKCWWFSQTRAQK